MITSIKRLGQLYAFRFTLLSIVALCCMPFHSEAGGIPWQLNFRYHDDGSLELINAQPIEKTKKSLISPGSKGALVEIPIEVKWLDLNENVIASAKANIPLGIRVPIGEEPAVSGLLMPSEVFVLRIMGPKLDSVPVHLVIDKQVTAAAAFAKSSPDSTQVAPALKPSQKFPLARSLETDLGRTPQQPPPGPGPTGVTKIQNTGADSNRLVLVVVGDGYLESDIVDGSYASDVNRTIAEFVNDSPWDEMMAATNIYRIDVISNEEGADYEDASPSAGGSLRDTYFNTRFWTSNIERLLAPNSTGRARAIAAADSFVGAGMWDQIVLVVNSTKYGGAGGAIATNSVNSSGPKISVHEVGHSFADLADEYVSYFGQTYPGGPPTEVNVDTNPSSPKWSLWINPSTPLPTPDTIGYNDIVGAFEGARYYESGIYRPVRNCTMRSLGAGFCPVCREQHLKSLFSVIDITDSVTPSTAVTVPISSEGILSVQQVPITNLEYEWSLGGVLLPDETAPHLTISTAQLAAQSQQVSVAVRYTSSMMRSGAPVENYTWTVENLGVTSEGTPHWWLSFHGLGVSDGIDLIDHDGDEQNTRDEYIADTNPNDSSAFLKFSSTSVSNGIFQLQWATSANRHYTLWESDNLTSWTPVPGYEDVAGTGNVLTYSKAVSAGKRFLKLQAWISD